MASDKRDIHGLKVVNKGTIITFNNMQDPYYKDEKLQLEKFENNLKKSHCQFLAYYYYDNKIHAKVSVILYREQVVMNYDGSKVHNRYGASVYYYHTKEDKVHYRMRAYPLFINLPDKYYDIIKYIHPCFKETFNQ
jgi:hypothetical protein